MVRRRVVQFITIFIILSLLLLSYRQAQLTSCYEPAKISNGRIYVFFHIYANHNTLSIVKDQINKIIWSGLYNRCDAIYVFMTGSEEIYMKQCSDVIDNVGVKFKIVRKVLNDMSYERMTLLSIHDYILPEDKFLYIHSKGVTKSDNITMDNVEQWRYLMEYFLIYLHERCISLLDEYDTVGVNHIGAHYSGNFWWTKGSYFMKLDNQYIADYYTAPEDYIMTKNPHFINLFSSGVDHYHVHYPLSNYVDKHMLFF